MFEKEIEERFIKSYPQFCCNGKPLSPYWDLWETGAELGYQKAQKEMQKSALNSLAEAKDCCWYYASKFEVAK